MNQSERSKSVSLRTYHRPTGERLETWDEVVDRIINHTNRLATEAGVTLSDEELTKVQNLFMERKALPAGRTLWLGGTDLAFRRPACQFNCSGLTVQFGDDIVDFFWLLLQGAGVGAYPRPGCFRGFSKQLPLTIVSGSDDPDFRGSEETYDELLSDGTWRIVIGDSAEGWARSIGKLLIHRPEATNLVLDFSNVRGAGKRLDGYGWICNGSAPLEDAYQRIVNLLNKRVGSLLTEIDIIDICNHLGTVLSSRRSAQIMLMDYNNPRWQQFSTMKDQYWVSNPQRAQSNNSLIFWEKPSRCELEHVFKLMVESGGCEPGFINGEAARSRAPWFTTMNPCAEIILADRGFCNLVEIDVAKFKDDFSGLLDAVYLMARLNYRQTMVDLNDGVLQRSWHQTNESLRLCGVSLTGLVRNDLTPWELRQVRQAATLGAYSQADEAGLERPKNITTGKPSGTLSKLMDTTEGIHKPLGKFMFNWISFSQHDPLVSAAKSAGYQTIVNPQDSTAVLIKFPVNVYEDVEWDWVDGKAVNLESAVDQLERYKKYMIHWCDQNMSNTISYSPDEVPEIIDWLLDNWDLYVGVSWIFRNDPTVTANDLGVAYLPQEVVTEQEYWDYVRTLKPVNYESVTGIADLSGSDCEGGACPVR